MYPGGLFLTHAVRWFSFERLVPRESGAINQIGVNNSLTSMRSAQATPKSPGAGQSGGSDSFQGTGELNVQVTPSKLGSAKFQQTLAEYSAAGIAVHVELVPEGTKVPDFRGLNEPDPPPQPAASPTPPPAQSATPPTAIESMGRAVVDTSGIAGALTAGAAAGVLGAVGGALIGCMLHNGGVGMGEMLAQVGVIGAVGATFMKGAIMAKAAMVIGAVTAAIGGGAIGHSLGRLLGKSAVLPPVILLGGPAGAKAVLKDGPKPQTATGKRLHPIASAMMGTGMMTGMAGGFVGGVSLLAAGTPFAQTLSMAPLGTAGLVAGCLGALTLGVAGALGAKKLTEAAVDGLSQATAAVNLPTATTP